MITRMGGNAGDKQSEYGKSEQDMELQRTLFESLFLEGGAGSSAPGGI